MSTVFILKTIQWVAIAVLSCLVVYATVQKPSEMQKHAIFLMLSCITMLLGSMIKWEASSLETAMMGASVAYIGKPYILLSAYMLISSFYGHVVPKKVYILLSVYLAIIPVLVFTNSYHHLYYATVSFDQSSVFSPLKHSNGPLYWLTVINSAIFVVLCLFVIINGYRKSKSPSRKRLTIYSVLMVITAMLGYAVYLLKLTNGYDSTMLGISLGAVFLSILFFRCRVFDIVDQAKEYALNISPEGLVVFDDSNSIVYKNKAADRMINENKIPAGYIEKLEEGENIESFNDSIYSVNIKNLTHKNDYLGKSVEIHDITSAHNYKTELERAVKDTTDRLSIIQRTIFGSIASIVEARSLETGDHIKRVSDYAEMIARKLQNAGEFPDILTEEYIAMLVLSAPLHDVGKISVSDSILLKPGKLTSDEFEEMKKHSASGAQIIRTTMKGLETDEYIDMAADVAMYHHERWDGGGYPCGLKGNNIPLSARIVAIADCYDAITSKRCYKEAASAETAVQIIKEESGTHFDPDVVVAFLNGISEKIGAISG